MPRTNGGSKPYRIWIMRTVVCLLNLCFSYLVYGQTASLQYVDLSQEDVSFSNEWSYPEGIFVNEYGQVSCDGLCPPEIYQMKISGKIIKDSLERFYELVDTSHQYHSMKAEVSCYEYGYAPFMKVVQQKDGTLILESAMNVATHCYLHIEIKDGIVKAVVILNSITNRPDGKTVFKLKDGGSIKIDQKVIKKGYLKAKFDLEFENHLEESKPIFWKGLVYSEIIQQ